MRKIVLIIIISLVLIGQAGVIAPAFAVTATSELATACAADVYFVSFDLSSLGDMLCPQLPKSIKDEIGFKYNITGATKTATVDIHIRFNNEFAIKGQASVTGKLGIAWWWCFDGVNSLKCTIADTEIKVSQYYYNKISELNNPYMYINLGFGTETYTCYKSGVSMSLPVSDATFYIPYTLQLRRRLQTLPAMVVIQLPKAKEIMTSRTPL
jgi:hypothetical protein